MKQLIKKIDTEIMDMNQDTNRGIRPLSLLLIELAKKYWELKRDYKRLKKSYELDTIKHKNIREEQLKKDDKKITDAELVRYATAQLIKDYETKEDMWADIEYLEPILNAYKDYINSWKFDLRETIQQESYLKPSF